MGFRAEGDGCHAYYGYYANAVCGKMVNVLTMVYLSLSRSSLDEEKGKKGLRQICAHNIPKAKMHIRPYFCRGGRRNL